MVGRARAAPGHGEAGCRTSDAVVDVGEHCGCAGPDEAAVTRRAALGDAAHVSTALPGWSRGAWAQTQQLEVQVPCRRPLGRAAAPRLRRHSVDRGTVVMALMAAMATVCTKLLAVDQRPRHGPPDVIFAVTPRTQLLLQGLAQRAAQARRAALQDELTSEPLRKMDALPDTNVSSAGVRALKSPRKVSTGYEHAALLRVPPVSTSRHALLADARGVGRVVRQLEADGRDVISDAEVEMRKVAAQMLERSFQPAWVREAREAKSMPRSHAVRPVTDAATAHVRPPVPTIPRAAPSVSSGEGEDVVSHAIAEADLQFEKARQAERAKSRAAQKAHLQQVSVIAHTLLSPSVPPPPSPCLSLLQEQTHV